MKYIRTKDGEIGIFRKAGDKNTSDFDYVAFKTYSRSIDNFNKFVKDYKQADTIEELCDEFVLVGKTIAPEYSVLTYEQALEAFKVLKNDKIDFIIYGAILTDKGRIHVAKMNEKGELELL